MPVTADDLKFFASAVMTDTDDGGGARASTVLQSGLTGAIFPAVSASARATGQVRLRKMYAGPTNADADALLGATLAINEVPTDPAVSVAIFRFGDSQTTRVSARGQVSSGGSGSVNPTSFLATATSGSAVITGAYFAGSAVPVDSYVDSRLLSSWVVFQGPSNQWGVRRFVSRSGSDITLNAPLNHTGLTFFKAVITLAHNTPSGRLHGACPVADAVGSGENALYLDFPIRAVALSETSAYNASTVVLGYGQIGSLLTTAGYATPVFANDQLTLWHEDTTPAATQGNGSTLDVGRTNLSQAAVVDADGVEVVRFLTTGPATPAAITANLATGVITFVNVAGLAQPLRVRHRIAHRSVANVVNFAEITLADPVTRDFPSGSFLCTHETLGDMQARALNAFAQQAWTSVWSDTLIGNASTLQYTGVIIVTNAGAETDRYRLQFSSATEFTAYSERLGLLGSGTTAADFSPLNPATGAPLFTLSSAGFAAGILVGSNFRFNTQGASAPVWVLQSIAPSTANGTTNTALRIYGSV